jgi:hypothetical protein
LRMAIVGMVLVSPGMVPVPAFCSENSSPITHT